MTKSACAVSSERGNGAEAAHRIHDEGGACVSHHSPDLFQRIYDAGRGLTMDRRHVCKPRARQALGNGMGGNPTIFRDIERFEVDIVYARHLGDASPVGAVHRDQQAGIARDRR